VPLAGAVSGVVEGLSIQPLELIKTRFQINAGERMRLLPTVRAILAEGGVAQLYRGALPEITGVPTSGGKGWGLHVY
jgi:solute carrier family 25 2-oxodicarboxylate transporter 21